MNSIHTSVVNCAIPIQYETLKTLEDLSTSSQSNLADYIGPISILAFFLFYPIITYYYLTANISKLQGRKDENFQKMHQYAFENIRYYRKNGLGLSYNLICHYRKILYSCLLVFMP